MRTLVIGGGSIGTRHLRNLQQLGVRPLAVAEPESARREALTQELGVQAFAGLGDGLQWEPELVVVASPTHLHVEQALLAARQGCHLFVEKPLSHTAERLHELAGEIRERGLISLVGCNMRFHPGPAQVKQLLAEQAVGRVLFARIHVGSYLPGWRSGQDYRRSYSANAAMGGGCILDMIHELDLARWYLGDVTEVFAVALQTGSLEINVEDVAALLCRHAGGALSEIHLDYVQRTYERGCQIVGEDGTIAWDFGSKEVRVYRAKDARWTAVSEPPGWSMNQMYIDETRHLLNCIQAGTPTTLPVPDALNVMVIALAAKRSALTGQFVRTGDVL